MIAFAIWSADCPCLNGDEPGSEKVIQSHELVGPAQASWGAKLTIRARMTGQSDVLTGSRFTWELVRRGADNSLITKGRGPRLARLRAATANVTLSLELPGVASYTNGLKDSDSDLRVLLRTDDGRNLSPLVHHSLHIETRDEAGRIDGQYVPRNYDLFAVQAGPADMNPDWLVKNGIRRGRRDVSWSDFEPESCHWKDEAFTKFGERLLLARRHDMTLLPILAGTPAWAASDGKGGWEPAKDIASWKSYVDKVVGHFSKPPYSQQYLQVWNEAPAQPFWPGNIPLKVYIEKVHYPAASAIRKHFVDHNGNRRMDDGERCLVV